MGAGLLVVTSERAADHVNWDGHPERPSRVAAVVAGIARAGVVDATAVTPGRLATLDELARVHDPRYLDDLQLLCAEGGGWLDGDTRVHPASWDAALESAGAGLAAIDALSADEADAAFCVVRPPGHHALPTRAMGFCLFNNAAVAAATLAERGERVLVLDWDAHHGNGTQEVFYADPRVLYVSLHQWPAYPGTGALDERGDGAGLGTTLNLPLPAGTTGDVALAAIDEVMAPVVEGFDPTWLVVSAGFDAHRADPLTGLGLSSGDFADLTRRVLGAAPAGRRLFILEGGYDLEALADSAAATVAAIVDEDCRPERATAGGPGRSVIDRARRLLRDEGLDL